MHLERRPAGEVAKQRALLRVDLEVFLGRGPNLVTLVRRREQLDVKNGGDVGVGVETTVYVNGGLNSEVPDVVGDVGLAHNVLVERMVLLAAVDAEA